MPDGQRVNSDPCLGIALLPQVPGLLGGGRAFFIVLSERERAVAPKGYSLRKLPDFTGRECFAFSGRYEPVGFEPVGFEPVGFEPVGFEPVGSETLSSASTEQ